MPRLLNDDVGGGLERPLAREKTERGLALADIMRAAPYFQMGCTKEKKKNLPEASESTMVSNVCHPPLAKSSSNAWVSFGWAWAVAARQRICCSFYKEKKKKGKKILLSVPQNSAFALPSSLTKENRPCIHKNVTKCQSLNHLSTSFLILPGQVPVSPISASLVFRMAASCVITTCMD